jgi:hypothetical protein
VRTGGYTPKTYRSFIYIYTWEFDTRRHRQKEIMNKKIKDKMITATVFLAEDTNGMVIHLNGFNDTKHADHFVKKLMKNSGIEYQSILDCTELPTLH